MDDDMNILGDAVDSAPLQMTLTRIAVDWTSAEVDLYRNHVNNYSPWINDAPKVGCSSRRRRRLRRPRNPSIAHLQAAANEFYRRFPFVSVEDDEERTNAEITSPKDSPFLLVAINVRDNWDVPDEFVNVHAVRFMLVLADTKDMSILFIKCMAGPEHGTCDGYITVDIDRWMWDNDLCSVLANVVDEGQSYRAKYPDKLNPQGDNANDRLNGKPYARLVIEVEYAHRSAHVLKKVGFLALNNPYTRLFLAVKIWPKSNAGDFGAVAILWGKDNEGVISCKKAVDFGSKQLPPGIRRHFEEQGNLLTMLPPVAHWTIPKPLQGYDSLRSELESYDTWEKVRNLPMTEGWCLTLPAEDMLFKTSKKQSTVAVPYILDDGVAIPDCNINLKEFAWQMNEE